MLSRSILTGATVPIVTFRRFLVSPLPDVEVVPLDFMKSHLRVTADNDDNYIAHLIKTATTIVEDYLSTYILKRSATLWMDAIPGMLQSSMIGSEAQWFDLMGSPIDSFTAFAYTDEASVLQTFPPAAYNIDLSDRNQFARVILNNGFAWPTDLRNAKGLQLSYVVGYANDGADVPHNLKHAIMLVAAALWSNRGDAQDGAADVLQLPSVRSILEPMRMRRISV